MSIKHHSSRVIVDQLTKTEHRIRFHPAEIQISVSKDGIGHETVMKREDAITMAKWILLYYKERDDLGEEFHAHYLRGVSNAYHLIEQGLKDIFKRECERAHQKYREHEAKVKNKK